RSLHDALPICPSSRGREPRRLGSALVDAVLGILAGFVSGVMSGAFGVGGAILTTPAVRVLLDAPPLVAVGTPLPAIFPTTVAGARAYRRAGLVDGRAVRWLAPPGVAAA